jgi:hypothetical protein
MGEGMSEIYRRTLYPETSIITKKSMSRSAAGPNIRRYVKKWRRKTTQEPGGVAAVCYST